MRIRLRSILLSWDTLLSIVSVVLALIFLPKQLSTQVCVTVYGTAISVLSIIFSIFFASLAVIMAFPDNEFIAFMETPDKLFSKLVEYFKMTLLALFLSLMYTMSIYIISTFSGQNLQNFNRPFFIVFVAAFVYSLIATAISIDVTLKLTSHRASYFASRYTIEIEPEEEGIK